MKKLTALCLALATALFATPRLDAATTTTNKVRAATYSQVTNLAYRITTLEEQMAMVQLGNRVVVTALTQDDVAVENQTVSIYEVADGGIRTLVATTNYNGSPVAFVVPPGMHYHVDITDSVPYHFSPTTADGYAEDNVTYLTLTYLDAGWTNGVSRLTTYSHIQTAVSRLYADKYAERIDEGDTASEADAASIAFIKDALIGAKILDTWTTEGGTAQSNPMICVDIDAFEGEDGETHVGAVMMREWATQESIAFDERNQDIATESVAQDGIYYYGFTVRAFDTDTACASGKFYTYDGKLYRCKAATTVGADWDSSKFDGAVGNLTDGKIPAYSTSTSYAENDLVYYSDPVAGDTRIYKRKSGSYTAGAWTGSTNWSMVTIDTLEADMTKQTSLSAGDSLDTVYATYFLVFRTSLNVSSGDYVKNAIRYGHNNWRDSAYRQYLNSDADIGAWWTQKHAGQIQPPQHWTRYGYKRGCSPDLLAAVKKVKIPTWPNSNTDGPNNPSTVYTTLDEFWLPSGNEMYGNVNANERGTFPYWRDMCYGAMLDAGCVISNFADRTSFPVAGASGVAYIAEDTGFVYAWRDDTGAYTGVVNNDDRSYTDYLSKTIVESTYASFPATGNAANVYFDTDTKKMWRWNNTAYAEITEAYYIYLATKCRIARARRQFAVNNHGSAVYCRLRSANRGYSNVAWFVYTTGYLYSYYAYYAYAGVPACVIW